MQHVKKEEKNTIEMEERKGKKKERNKISKCTRVSCPLWNETDSLMLNPELLTDDTMIASRTIFGNLDGSSWKTNRIDNSNSTWHDTRTIHIKTKHGWSIELCVCVCVVSKNWKTYRYKLTGVRYANRSQPSLSHLLRSIQYGRCIDVRGNVVYILFFYN